MVRLVACLQGWHKLGRIGREMERMNAKHTPGPWRVAGKRDGLRLIRSDAVDMPVANAFDDGNAALIAAAPELLAALRPLVAIVNGARVKRDKRAQYLDEARSAIAKATGAA